MPQDGIPHPAYTNEDVAKWVISRTEATRKPGAVLPTWLTGIFDAMKQEKEAEAAGASAQLQRRGRADQRLVQDDVFKFELVYFKVENTVFTVIKDWLMVEGSPFPAMFALPAPAIPQTAVEGSDIANPIFLEQTSAASFKAFLCLLYGPTRGKRLQTYDEWVGALELALRWNFDQVRKEAIAGLNPLLSSLGPLARIQLSRRFSVGPWLRTGLIDLVTDVAKKRVTRNELINEKEFTLDMATIANVAFACFELKGHDQEFEVSPATQYCGPCTSLVAYGWGHNPQCSACKSLRDETQALRRDAQYSLYELKVDEIFGAEIEGCLYY